MTEEMKTSCKQNARVKRGLETNVEILERRRKQIEFGKNTLEYEAYSKTIQREDRLFIHPTTPRMHRKYSRRAWDGLIKRWRVQLHQWDHLEDLLKESNKGENESCEPNHLGNSESGENESCELNHSKNSESGENESCELNHSKNSESGENESCELNHTKNSESYA